MAVRKLSLPLFSAKTLVSRLRCTTLPSNFECKQQNAATKPFWIVRVYAAGLAP